MDEKLDKLADTIRTALREAYPGMDVWIHPTPNRLGCYIVYVGFTGVPQWNRLNAVWRALEGVIDAEERELVGGCLCLTAAELESLRRNPQYARITEAMTICWEEDTEDIHIT